MEQRSSHPDLGAFSSDSQLRVESLGFRVKGV